MKAVRRGVLRAGAALVLGSAVWAGNAAAAAAEPLPFGLALPMTGPQALFGADQAKAAQWAVDDINAKGGVNGRPLKMVLLDTQADPRQGINAVNRMISVDKVPVFGTAWSSVVKSVAPIANRSQTLELSVGANSPEIARLGDYVYTTYPLADVDIRALAKYSHDTLKKQKAAVLYIHNDSGVEGARIYRESFTAAGGQVVAYEAYDEQSTDYTGALLKVRAAQPDIIHIQGLVADLPQVITQLRRLGISQPITTYSAGYNPTIVKQLGAAGEGLIVSSLAPSPELSPTVAKFVERWQSKEHRIPNGLPYTQYLYDMPYLIADLYKHVLDSGKPVTGATIRAAMVQTGKFDLPMTGTLEVLPDHRVSKPVYLYQVKDGKFVALATVK